MKATLSRRLVLEDWGIRIRRWACASIALGLLSGCAGLAPVGERAAATSPPAQEIAPAVVPEARAIDPALLEPPAAAFVLGPGDRLEIEIIGDPSTRSAAIVGPDGKIYFYLLPGLDVWGLTIPQTQALIAQELKKYTRLEPTVAVTLRAVESQRVWLLGRLNNPGVYPINGPTTLLEALALAGGPSSASALASLGGAFGAPTTGATGEAADLRHSFVIRQGRLLPVDFHRLLREGDLAQNVYLQSGDFVYLPSAAALEVHVLGAVAQPRSVDFVNQLTLLQVIAGAGGTIKDAYLSHVAIVRGTLTEPKIAIVDYHETVRGRAPDVLLEPHDIVYVPFAPYRTLTRYANLILETFARTVGVNEGARAISTLAVPVGINVPVGR